MAVRLWPNEFERKEHITKAEKSLLRNALRNFKDGHFAVGIDPLGMATDKIKFGMYISPTEGLITFSVSTDALDLHHVKQYIAYVNLIEQNICNRLLDSKLLIVRNENRKILKFPYKHVCIFPNESSIKNNNFINEKNELLNYVVINFFRPINSLGREKTVSDLKIFNGVRIEYDKNFKELSKEENCAIFERLAPEYVVVMNEKEEINIAETTQEVTERDMLITGNEKEYKTFFLDEYQVAQVNDMGRGHRVILANPGAGKSVLLLSKAFKYASIYKNDSKVLLTCFNSNLADSYIFKSNCANYGNNKNLYIMTFHKLVKKIYNEILKIQCNNSIVTDEEIRRCIDYIKMGKVKLKFKAIFIDEVQNFDPLYLELCYCLLDKGDDSTFLMAGDLNQSVRAKSRKGDVPWKQMENVKLDFSGRVKYIEKNYRNSREIAEYIKKMLERMNTRFEILNMINSLEYEYNSFKIGSNPTLALKIKAGIDRKDITKTVIASIKEITSKYNVSYSDIAILFPFREKRYLKYYFFSWIKAALSEEGIPYTAIISDKNDKSIPKKITAATGIVVSTIESSLGLDFKAVILAGLYPYNYIFQDQTHSLKVTSWEMIGESSEKDQELVQSQMRSIYTACSRARDILYVLSDIEPGTPMDELIQK